MYGVFRGTQNWGHLKLGWNSLERPYIMNYGHAWHLPVVIDDRFFQIVARLMEEYGRASYFLLLLPRFAIWTYVTSFTYHTDMKPYVFVILNVALYADIQAIRSFLRWSHVSDGLWSIYIGVISIICDQMLIFALDYVIPNSPFHVHFSVWVISRYIIPVVALQIAQSHKSRVTAYWRRSRFARPADVHP
jgi:hypothetical protein